MSKLSEIDQKSPEFMLAINAFIKDHRGYFLMAGSHGNGKTFTAKAIFNKFWHPGSDNQFWNQADLKLKWQDTFNEYGSTTYLLGEIVKAPLLVLDDIGIRAPTEAFLEFLYIIAEKRYESKNNSGTIITTNLNSQAMREQFGDAFVSRIASGVCLRWDGPDRRCSKF